ncbi:unnamed protein product [Didymodactylos carnosus]|uniref:Uncharacterized protein n=1 Tax=Didymodactylos carnosus TaxID=1234261 RepID=A0A813ZV39_9BILA|nr:unnamed protein product [Didymodactylos carnosus]CAF1143671.1 unnamed protein product [Didymodactylos carnosus]CAF3686043.1 unnamed protein product [Didymodactylos carnosus]CAF3942884.1 unnamed protein product [Didymodactylos carnosus]
MGNWITSSASHGSTVAGKSPQIKEISWGKVDIDSIGEVLGKNVQLYPGGASKWDWKESNTSHELGIQLADVQRLIDNKLCDVLVLSRGMEEQLQISEGVYDYFRTNGMKLNEHYYIEQTEKAVEIYNQLSKRQRRVGALIHSTC